MLSSGHGEMASLPPLQSFKSVSPSLFILGRFFFFHRNILISFIADQKITFLLNFKRNVHRVRWVEKQLLNKKWKLGLGLRVEGSDPGSLSVPSAAREADGIFISQSEISLKRVARTKSWVDRVTPIFSLVQTFSKNIPPICWSHTHTQKNGGTDENLVTLFFFVTSKSCVSAPKSSI